jgi:hypothetical protein
MRKAIAVLLLVLLLAPELPARNKSEWEEVEKLKPRTPLVIFLWSGEELHGRLITVSDTGLHLSTPGRISPGAGGVLEVERTSIHRIKRLCEPKLPNPGRWMVTSTLAGGAIGLTAGAISDGTHGVNNGGWIKGGLGGAGIGFFASCAVLAGIGAGDLTVQLFHRSSLVYEDKGHSPISTH